MTHPGICRVCHHHGETFESGLCLCCEWDRLREVARATDSEEDWAALDWLNRYVEETVG
jgi:hypothetical protein